MKKKAIKISKKKFNYKIACIHHRDVLKLFNKNIRDSLFAFTFFDKIPDDVIIKNVWFDPYRQSFMYLLEHKSFKKVSLGKVPEIICPDIYEVQIEIKERDKKENIVIKL